MQSERLPMPNDLKRVIREHQRIRDAGRWRDSLPTEASVLGRRKSRTQSIV